jgi:hypothetical protein
MRLPVRDPASQRGLLPGFGRRLCHLGDDFLRGGIAATSLAALWSPGLIPAPRITGFRRWGASGYGVASSHADLQQVFLEQ